MQEDKTRTLPRGFLWGASVSSHQVEGGNHNQWTEWEKANAEHLASTAEQRLSYMPCWDEIKSPATKPETYISGRGVEHYEHYEQDFDLLQELNLNSFRFSIEWSRLEPEEGVWNEQEIQHYLKYIKALHSRGIEPVLNIWHWTHPVWFEAKGGFKNKSNLKYFDRYVEKIAKEYGNLITYYITVNEPNVYSSFGYMTKDPTSNVHWPPEEKNVLSLARVFIHLIQAHKRSYKILKQHNAASQIGIATQLANIQSKNSHNLLSRASTKIMRYFWNWWFVNRVRRHQDFLGFNYYFTDYYDGLFRRKNPKAPVSDLGWYMEPEGLYPVLLQAWARYKKPIIITENGVADAHDEHRRWWIEQTIVAIQRATSEGVQVVGYFHWSLLDNFEWATGWIPKFGLVEVDRANSMKRTIRPSAKWFAKTIKERG